MPISSNARSEQTCAARAKSDVVGRIYVLCSSIAHFSKPAISEASVSAAIPDIRNINEQYLHRSATDSLALDPTNNTDRHVVGTFESRV